MAFTYTNNITDNAGKKMATGTYTSSGGGTGGAIVTGLANIEFFTAPSATSTPSTYSTLSNGTATITTTANQTGTWLAIGT